MRPSRMRLGIIIISPFSMLFLSPLIVCRITPNEWHDPQPWKDRNNELETRLNVANLIWFSCGTMLQQGSDISPQ